MKRLAIPVIVLGVILLSTGIALGCVWNAGCWLTGGGLKLEPAVNMRLAERGAKQTFGGNIYPGCSPEAGAGGQWNHVDHYQKIHFQGWTVQEVNCGYDGSIGPSSTSPDTPFNFIEARGTGTIKGIQGNKFPEGTVNVNFFLRAEDLNEPGNQKANAANGGVLIDRYYLHVWDSDGLTYLLIDTDNAAGTVDPVTITGGNLQLHVSSCP
jgi:hypothetical protein